MKIIKTKKITKDIFLNIKNSLLNKLIIVLPTDTIYGLSALASNTSSINKINKIKNRDKNKTFIILMDSYKMVEKYCIIEKEQKKYLKATWKKNEQPTTVILETKNLLPKTLTKDNSIAVRIPQNIFLKKLIKKIEQPIISTSLNLSGQKPLENLEDLKKYFLKNKPDLVLDIGVLKGNPSRLIDLRDIKNIKILR